MGSELNLMLQVEGSLRGMNLGEFAGCFSFTTFFVGRLFEEVLIRKEDDDSFSDCVRWFSMSSCRSLLPKF